MFLFSTLFFQYFYSFLGAVLCDFNLYKEAAAYQDGVQNLFYHRILEMLC